jgi:hypothetical protein
MEANKVIELGAVSEETKGGFGQFEHPTDLSKGVHTG